MAIYHLSMSAVQRSKGRSAVASAAYRSGDKLVDPRQGMTFDYRRKDRIQASDIIVPAGAPLTDRQNLWGSVELHHKRKDACTAREIEVALPHEADEPTRLALTRDLAKHIADRYGVAVDYAVHTSTGQGDNWHAHLLCTTALYGSDGLGKKAIDLDPHECGKAGIPSPADTLRPRWEQMVNQALERSGRAERIDHRSLEAQGIDRPATIHTGWGTDSRTLARREYNTELVGAVVERDRLQAAIDRKRAETREVDMPKPDAMPEVAHEDHLRIVNLVVDRHPDIDWGGDPAGAYRKIDQAAEASTQRQGKTWRERLSMVVVSIQTIVTKDADVPSWRDRANHCLRYMRGERAEYGDTDWSMSRTWHERTDSEAARLHSKYPVPGARGGSEAVKGSRAPGGRSDGR